MFIYTEPYWDCMRQHNQELKTRFHKGNHEKVSNRKLTELIGTFIYIEVYWLIMVSESNYVGIKNTCSVCGEDVTITFHQATPSVTLDIFRNTEGAKCSVCHPHSLWLRQ